MSDLTDSKAREKVWNLIKDIRIAQVVTHGDNGLMHARPMESVNKDFDGAIWFLTSADSPKIEEIAANPNVLALYSDISKQSYLSIQGRAEILNDRAKIAELWAEPARIWFPKGKDDPMIRLVRIDVTRAEYWDNPASTLMLIYGYAVARLTGEAPEIGENKKVAFN